MDAYLQAVQDDVDILNLSVGPNSPPTATRTTFLNPFDAALLSAVKAGVFVAQAAGNGGPFPKTLVSFSPWITTVAAGVDDRRYKNHLILGNGKLLPGLGVSRKFFWSVFQQTYAHLYSREFFWSMFQQTYAHLYSLSFTYNRSSQNEIEPS
jgi:subtilisin family serine protease